MITALVAFPLALGIGAAALSGGAALAAKDASAATVFETVHVSAGDTLWSIAERVAPDRDPREVVDEIRTLNQIEASELIAGVELAIPAKFS